MSNDFLGSNNIGKSISSNATREDPIIELELKNEGYNLDIAPMYSWHLNFPYYTGKGYIALKLEDSHYFSENSQFGQNLRQVKGGSIRAFQENLQQLIQLVKVHIMPLLKEVKEADFLKKWFDKIVENDKIVQDLLKSGVSNENSQLKKARAERNEAIRHIKDKWVNEIDGGRLWQMANSANERGLDFALTPQLFMGVQLDNPLVDMHGKGKSLQEQLEGDIYSVDVTQTAKDSVGNYMFRFHTWLPSAIKDTNISFKLRISTLKQFYAQLQMYVDVMKPLLIEIARKKEGLNFDSFYKDFEIENPEFVTLFDTAFSYIKILGIRDFGLKERGQMWTIDDLEFSKYGLFLKTKKDIVFGSQAGKTGFIKSEKNKKYEFYPTSKKDLTRAEFEKIKMVEIDTDDLKSFPIMEFNFSQKRRNEIVNSPQGQQQLPYMKNSIGYKGYSWNIFQIATYRSTLKLDNLDLLETFIGEIKIVRDDLLYYVNDLEKVEKSEENSNNSEGPYKVNENSNNSGEFSLILGPIKALGYILSPLIPNFNFSKRSSSGSSSISNSKKDEFHNLTRIQIAEDVWKLYTINKKVHGFIQY